MRENEKEKEHAIGSTKAKATSSTVEVPKKLPHNCAHCRKARTKCDKQYPSCRRCIRKGLTCVGGDKPAKRGRPTGPAIKKNVPDRRFNEPTSYFSNGQAAPSHNGSTNVTNTSVSHNSRTSSADGVTKSITGTGATIDSKAVKNLTSGGGGGCDGSHVNVDVIGLQDYDENKGADNGGLSLSTHLNSLGPKQTRETSPGIEVVTKVAMVTVEKMLPTEAREAAASPPLDQTVVQQQQQQQQQQQTTSVETAGTNKSVQDQALAEGNVDEISSRVDVIHSGDKDEQEDKETDELHGGEAAQRREQQSRSSLSSNAQPRVLVVGGGGDGSDSSGMDDPSRRHTGLLLAVSNRTSNLECSNSSSGGENLNEGDDDAPSDAERKKDQEPLIDNENVMELEECEFYFYLVLFLFVLQFTLHRDQSKVVLRLVSLTKNVSLKFLHFLLIPKFSAGFFGDSA